MKIAKPAIKLIPEKRHMSASGSIDGSGTVRGNCRMAEQTEGEDWLPALDASQRLAPRVDGLTRARALLATGLHAGMLSAAAESSSISESEDADFVQEKAALDELLGIPSEVWCRSDNCLNVAVSRPSLTPANTGNRPSLVPRSEPRRVCRRLFGLSHAAIGRCSIMA